jgi:aminopeptidase N
VVVALTAALAASGPSSALSTHTSEPVAPAPYTAVQHVDSVYPSVGHPGVDVVKYDLSLRWRPSTRTLVGVATLRLRVGRDGGFRLDLGRRLSVGAVTVRDASTRSTLASTYAHPGRYLTVSSASLRAGDTYLVTVRYRGRPAPAKAPSSRGDMRGVGWHTTRSGQVWAMQEPYGAFTWYPVNDHPSDKATYDVRLDVPRRWVGVSNGRMTSRRVGHGRTVTRFTNADPMASYLVTVAVGPYRRYTQTGPHGLPLTYWVPRNRPGLVRPLRATPSAIRWLESRLGPYPFDRAGVVVTPSGSAMETQTMITFGAENYHYGQREVRQTVLHELAHAWYGDTVTPADWSDVWMNEGMATYVEARYSTAKGWSSWARWLREFDSRDAMWRRLYGPPGAYHADEFAQVNVYYSAARMLVRLRERIGAPVFDELMRRWPQEHRGSVQDRTSYVLWLAEQTGEDPNVLRAWFDEWLTSPTPPS